MWAALVAMLWRGLVSSRPLVHLADFTLCSRSQGAAAPALSSDELADAVAEHGLKLDEETVTDGNCGLDSILRNLERLRHDNDAAKMVLQNLQKKAGNQR